MFNDSLYDFRMYITGKNANIIEYFNNAYCISVAGTGH